MCTGAVYRPHIAQVVLSEPAGRKGKRERDRERYSRGADGGWVVSRTKDGTRRFICLVFLRGIRERAGDTWYPYRHHLIEAKQSDETNKREGMRTPSPPSSSLRCLSRSVHLAIYTGRFFFFSPPSKPPLLHLLCVPYERNSSSPSRPVLSRLDHLRPRSSYSDLGRSNTCANSERRRDRWTRR